MDESLSPTSFADANDCEAQRTYRIWCNPMGIALTFATTPPTAFSIQYQHRLGSTKGRSKVDPDTVKIERQFQFCYSMNEANLRSLYTLMSEWFDKIKIVATRNDGATMTYQTIDGLIKYDNISTRKITKISFMGNNFDNMNNFSKMEIFEINLNPKNVTISISGKNELVNIAYQKLSDILATTKSMSDYFYFMDIFEVLFFYGLSQIAFAFIVYNSLTVYHSYVISEGKLINSDAVRIVIILSSYIFGVFILKWARSIALPTSVFLIGDEYRRTNRRKEIVVLIFSAIFVSTIVGLFVNFISSKIF